ncbi:MAG: M6 family metalloprotease domain-containing protein [Candidatus Bathyarchaeia archaeon]
MPNSDRAHARPLPDRAYVPPLDGKFPKEVFSPGTEYPKAGNISLPAVEGARRVIAILVDFPDLNHTKSKEEIRDMVFRQMDAYWREVSYGTIWIEGDVTDWLKLDRSMSYYGEDFGMIDTNGLELVRDAISKADPWVDFSRYEYVVIIHAGCGQESSYNPFDIWSVHYFSIYPPIFADGVRITSASVAPEMERDGVSLGTIAHEFGHALGLPDLYDVNYIDPGHFVDGWCVMGTGSKNGNPRGSMPPHPMIWCKIKLGWVKDSNIITVRTGEYVNVTLQPSELKTSGYLAIKLPLPDGRYYLVEARQNIGFDAGLPNYGILISLIDESRSSGNGIVRIINADPTRPSLSNASFKPSQEFKDADNGISVSIMSQYNLSFLLIVNRKGPVPDLRIEALGIDPKLPRAGDNVTISIAIKNVGSVKADQFRLRLYIDNELVREVVLSLGPGEAREVKAYWIAKPGEHLLRAIVNEGGEVPEGNLSDNRAELNVTVGVLLALKGLNPGAIVKIDGKPYEAGPDGKAELMISPGRHEVEVPLIIERGSTREIFSKWGDGEASNPRGIVIEDDTVMEALYRRQYLIAVEANGGIASGGGWYDEGSRVQVSAQSIYTIEDRRWRKLFIGWSGDSHDREPSITIPVDGPRRLVANWRDQFFLEVRSQFGNPSGSGWYDMGSMASIRVDRVIDLGNGTRRVFVEWDGDLRMDSNEAVVRIDGPKSVIAKWKTQYEVAISAAGMPKDVELNITINGDLRKFVGDPIRGWFDADSEVRFDLEPKSIKRLWMSWELDHWKNSKNLKVASPLRLIAPENITGVFVARSLCTIYTALYGTPLMHEADLLRSFRDEIVLPTFIGKCFFSAFDPLYYSFSPHLSYAVSRNAWAKSATAILLFPLVKSLSLAASLQSALGLNNDLGVILSGIVITFLIGGLYFAPLIALIFFGLRGRTDIPSTLKKSFAFFFYSFALTAAVMILSVILRVEPSVAYASLAFAISSTFLAGFGLIYSIVRIVFKP